MPQAVIMAGGQGERFWPLTSDRFPKYCLAINGRKSLVRKTFDRLARLYSAGNIHVVTTREHVPIIRRELPGLKKENLIVEPFRNNTASAILLATAKLARRYGEEEVISFFPADHLIEKETLFRATLKKAMDLARERALMVIVGITPRFPATGYGYIEQGKPLSARHRASHVKAFREKPDRATAKRYIAAKRFYWNAGMFTWRGSTFLDTLHRFAPAFTSAFHLKDVPASYRRMPKESIDYALMEKADNLALVRTDMDWCDMGNWDMYYEKARLDRNRNCVEGPVRVDGVKNSLILNYSKKPFAASGLNNAIIVHSAAGTLKCLRGEAEEAARARTRR